MNSFEIIRAEQKKDEIQKMKERKKVIESSACISVRLKPLLAYFFSIC
jgi:hypothetical protein